MNILAAAVIFILICGAFFYLPILEVKGSSEMPDAT